MHDTCILPYDRAIFQGFWEYVILIRYEYNVMGYDKYYPRISLILAKYCLIRRILFTIASRISTHDSARSLQNRIADWRFTSSPHSVTKVWWCDVLGWRGVGF